MSPAQDPHSAFEALDAASRALAEAVAAGCAEQLQAAAERQSRSFEAVRTAIEAGAALDAETRSRLLRSAKAAERVAGARREEIRGELDTLREARSTALRIQGAGSSARFVSRRV